ncbi:MAG: NUDIX hydrolase [Candidatus Bipolaricaulota bacterium]|nr:NUDIX hydrolase [Candidatus Bipolaricaulota bacterium]MDW8030807.1 NUDIX hydrolase [Candidatus Bipolaricaulota bacterium]
MCEKTLASRHVFVGRLLKMRVDDIALEGGRRTTREIVEHPGAVAIVALQGEGDNQQVVLVRQFRKAAEQFLVEIPAGTLEPGEDPLACAQRELLEETGLSAERWSLLQTFYTAPGFCTERMWLYLAQGLRSYPQNQAVDEQIEVGFYSRAQVKELLRNQQIQDAKTLVGLLWWLCAL